MYSWVLLCHNHASFYDGKIRKIFISFKESEGDKGSRKPEKRYTRYLLQFTCAEGNCVLLMAYLKVTSWEGTAEDRLVMKIWEGYLDLRQGYEVEKYFCGV